MGVRDAKKAETRQALADAAMDLFSRHGYDAVTMADIAEAAGVSRRTAFRYFAAKDDLAMEYPLQWLSVFDDAVEANQDCPIEVRLRHASHAIADHIERHPEPVKQAFRLAFTHPALAAKYAAVSRLWIDRVAAEVGGTDELTPADQMRAQMLGSAVMGMIDSVCGHWALSDEPMGPLLDQGFDLLDVALRA